MQAQNLRPEDLKKLEDVFKDIVVENPDAKMYSFLQDKFNPKDCLFQDKCTLKSKRR